MPQGGASKEVVASHDGLFELLLMGAVSLAGFYALYKRSSLYLDRASRLRKGILPKLSQPTCASCRFFDRNSASKCHLHSALVEERGENDCVDYWHLGRSKFLHH